MPLGIFYNYITRVWQANVETSAWDICDKKKYVFAPVRSHADICLNKFDSYDEIETSQHMDYYHIFNTTYLAF